MTRGLRAALILVAVGLALALAIPWPPAGLPSVQGALRPAAPPSVAAQPERPPATDPARIAALLVGARSVQEIPVPLPSTPEQPAVAPWLRYVGSAAEADGSPVFYLKDARNGKVIRVGPGTAQAGWSLEDVTDERLVVRSGDETYWVSRR